MRKKSAYARRNKQPFNYSPQYRRWRDAFTHSDKMNIDEAGEEHTKYVARKFGPFNLLDDDHPVRRIT